MADRYGNNYHAVGWVYSSDDTSPRKKQIKKKPTRKVKWWWVR